MHDTAEICVCVEIEDCMFDNFKLNKCCKEPNIHSPNIRYNALKQYTKINII